VTDNPGIATVRRAARWAGLTLEARQLDLLEELADWLVAEAIPAGGLGPAEGSIVFSRHLADSLLFAAPWRSEQGFPSTILDIGAGVGLPGLPLAISWPSSRVTLLERSLRRTDLARRAVRILGLDNVEVAATQLGDWKTPADLLVCRAVSTPDRLRGDLQRLLSPAGVAVVGGSHSSAPTYQGFSTRQVPSNILGKPVWLLIMDKL